MTSPGDRLPVLWLTKGLGPGGAERLLLSFAQLADHERFDLHAAYLLPHKDHLVGELHAAGITTHCLHGARVADPRWIGRLRTLVRQYRIRVVHNHSPLVAGQARPALRILPRTDRPALVGTEHNEWGSHAPPTRLLNRATIGLEDHTFAVSDQVRDSMPSGTTAEVLVHGIDVDAISARRHERDAARRRHGLSDGTLCVVTIANLRANKDYPTMLAAARRLVDDGVDVTFLSIGQGPLEDDLRAHHAEIGLGDRFRFLGYRADPIADLAAGDVFCLSSRFEGLSIALLEAMAMGLVPVVTSVGGVPSVVTHGENGTLVEPGCPDALAAGIRPLVGTSRREALATAALHRSQDFTMQNAVARQQHVYESLA